MANELTLTANAALVNGGLKETFAPGTLKINQSTLGSNGATQVIGTGGTDMLVGSVGTYGYLFLQNVDPTNFVSYGPKVGGSMQAFAKLKPLEIGLLRLDPATTVRLTADTAQCKVKTLLLEN